MLNETNLYNYQRQAIEHVIDNPYSALFLECGLGKTVATLTAIDRLMNDSFEISKVLVIAPKRVAEDTWIREKDSWSHLRHLRLSIVLGTEKQRKEALLRDADIYVINRENVAWLVCQYQSAFPFDMVVIDELSSFKSPKSQRFKALRMVRPKISRVVGLTGTPAPNGLLDLWSQLYLLDQGERLGRNITGYRSEYFRPGRSNGQVVFDYKLMAGSQERIYSKIKDICVSMKAEDYLELPERIDRKVPVHLPAEDKARYEDFEREQVLALADEENISAVNAAALTNKLLQFANGAVYNEDRDVKEIHYAKLEALSEIVETATSPVLIAYAYKHDLSRIKRKLKAFKPVELKDSSTIAAWNKGDIQVLLAHPASAGHGLNLQAGGNNIIWFGLTWSLELYQQFNARLHRQGQKNVVVIHHLLTEGTMDERVIKAIENKATGQEALMQAVKAIIKKHRS